MWKALLLYLKAITFSLPFFARMFKTAKKRDLTLAQKAIPDTGWCVCVGGAGRTGQSCTTRRVGEMDIPLTTPLLPSSLAWQNGHSSLEMHTDTTLNAKQKTQDSSLSAVMLVAQSEPQASATHLRVSYPRHDFLFFLELSYPASLVPSSLSPIFVLWCSFQTLTSLLIPRGTGPKIQQLIL